MNERDRDLDGEPIPDDPFLADDPAAREREARRLERERRRAERAAADTKRTAPAPGSAGKASKQASESVSADQGPSPAERVSAALSGLGDRVSARRSRRAEEAPPQAEASPPDTADEDATYEDLDDASGPADEHGPDYDEAPDYDEVPDYDDELEYDEEPGYEAPADRRRRLPRATPVAVVLAIVVVGALLFLNALFQPFHGGGEGTVVFEVPEGASAGEVADLLDEQGVIDNSTLFEVRLTLAGRRGDLFAGNYSLAEGMSYSEVISELSSPPSQRTVTITVPEGHSREQIARLATDAGLDGNYERASRSSDDLNLSKYGAQGAESLEGFLFPATYELEAGANARDLVAEQVKSFRREFSDVNMGPARRRDLSPYEVLIIASMIEREVMVDDERRLVSSVIHNRLAVGEPLGIDATIRYALGNYDEPLKQSELELDSPYNTRTNAGLPPTPIGNPGLESIKAAAKPRDTDFMFYVVKPGTCGEHEFTETLAEFEAASARYNEAREEAGGRSPTEC